MVFILKNVVLSTIKNEIKNAIIAVVFCIITTAILSSYTNPKKPIIDYSIYEKTTVVENYIDSIARKQFERELHDIKVKELERCMHEKYYKCKGRFAYNPNDIKLSAEKMVTACENHEYDLILAASQAWNESLWGTTGRAKLTNSVFSVGCYDNGVNAVKYDTINDSIEPYILLMKNDYGINPTTVKNILSGAIELKNKSGKRYATSETYEKALNTTYQSIKKEYPILAWNVDTYIENKKESI